MKYRPSKSFVLAMAFLCPVLAALIFGLLPELEALRNPPIPGEITFPPTRPARPTAPAISKSAVAKSAVAKSPGRAVHWSIDWLISSYEDLMGWEHNPWKSERVTFGSHYSKLLESKSPADKARAKELRWRAEALHQRVLKRYPELAVADKNVPPERNGFLKWLEFSERMDADPARPGFAKGKDIGIPGDLKNQLAGEAPWDAEAVRTWLASEKPLLDEVRTIGLMPDESITGIEIDRWAFISARLAKSCTDALLLESRLAAGQGDVAAALESIQAANGLAAHLGNVETPSLLAITVLILIRMQIQRYVFSDIMPALPAGQLDAQAWENAVKPTVSPPAEFARIMVGEWNVTAREYVLPMLADTEDPKYPPDPAALIDFQAGAMLDVVRDHEGRSLADLPTIPILEFPDNSQLSRTSRELTQMLFVGSAAWRKGWERTQAQSALTQAAFAIMKGQPVPNDPIYGQPYVWDPATRQLSPPSAVPAGSYEIKPITVPKP